MKKCPYCAEEILEAAVRCRHCRSDLAGPVPRWFAGLGLLASALTLGLLLLQPALAGVRSPMAPSGVGLAAGSCPAQDGSGFAAARPGLPPGHPPVDGLPPGHPPVALPPGHPPVELPDGPAASPAPIFPQDVTREL